MENFVKYDPLEDKSPIGVVAKNNKVEFKINTDRQDIELAYLVMKKDEDSQFRYIEMTRTSQGYICEQTFENAGHYWYVFQIKIEF